MPTSTDQLSASHGFPRLSTSSNPLKRAWTPVMSDAGSLDNHEADAEAVERNNARQERMRTYFEETESKLLALFEDSHVDQPDAPSDENAPDADDTATANHVNSRPNTDSRKPARTIDEDDYGDDDDDEDDHSDKDSPLRARSGPMSHENGDVRPLKPPSFAMKLSTTSHARPPTSSGDQAKTSEDARKRLQEQKIAREAAARESFRTIFYTLENDRDAMLEQQKLDEIDRQVETEIAGQTGTGSGGSASAKNAQQGSLSSANLGSSSLTFKHLVARIDSKRNQVKASNAQLRSLMSDVRKNRSKWASDTQVGQEELYESLEKVLLELKSMTEYAAPFLQKVNKREAPDYYNIITKPMDFSTMLRKLNQHNYKSKKEFVDDLNLIWANCLKYNADPAHFLRKKALHMRKETEKLVPLIPNIVVRDRAEVEAEERRLHQAENDDGAEDSDDEEPIMASRGRKAPGKTSKKGGPTSRKAPPADEAGNEAKPPLGPLGLLKEAESGPDLTHAGLSTPPPPGVLTPLGVNGFGSAAPGSHADPSETDGVTSSIHGVLGSTEDIGEEDQDFKTWKLVTKKDRAHAAAERHNLFKGDRLNPEEPALLRSKASMRRWIRQQKPGPDPATSSEEIPTDADASSASAPQNGTLAEGIDGEEDRNLPDYYDPLSAIPQLDERLAWQEDNDGEVIDMKEEFLRVVPQDTFKAPSSLLTSRIESNNRQLQETRKIVSKIGIVKQMQLQTQTYQNQFQKYEPEPFTDPELEPYVVSEEGPIMSRYVCRAALQKAVGKIFYHAGFEEFQPSAMEAITDMASDYFANIVRALNVYRETPKTYEVVATPTGPPAVVPATLSTTLDEATTRHLISRFSPEEAVLHALHEGGTDIDTLETYVKEDVERLGSKLEVQHVRLREHLAELLRPALDPSYTNVESSANAFKDGSEQFVGGDILAEDIDEDFFGFKEMGLDREFGLASLSVPFHLLQSRVRNAFQPANDVTASDDGLTMKDPPKWPHLTTENLKHEIGLIQEFFMERLEASEDGTLIEDDELPTKARFPKPRLPPTGKITSPRKRPIREQQMLARKKRKLEKEESRAAEGGADADAGDRDADEGLPDIEPEKVRESQLTQVNGIATPKEHNTASSSENNSAQKPALPKPISKLRLEMPPPAEQGNHGDPEKNGEPESATGMLSPESLPIAVN